MTPEQVDRLLGLLERLVVATERQVPFIPTTGTAQQSGYTCPICRTLVQFGHMHSCGGSISGSRSSRTLASAS